MTVQEFKNFLSLTIKQISTETGIPYAFMMSQIALETAWGKSELLTKYFNVGGIKAVDGHDSVMEWTTEDVDHPEKFPARNIAKDQKLDNGKTKIYIQLPFAKFPDLKTGLEYYLHNVLLNEYFKPYIAQASGDPIKYVQLLQSGGADGKHPKYATGSKYVETITSLIKSFS